MKKCNRNFNRKYLRTSIISRMELTGDKSKVMADHVFAGTV